ncbi:MAG: DUF2254 domain-containing protein [Rhodospirillales bacterium]|nr:DUF2254 domain-containing protein [Rhodospirillales bacterium]
MKLLLVRLWSAFYGSYWFIPATMAFAAVCLAFASIWADMAWNQSYWPQAMRWLLLSQPDGARAVLQVIAGSMVTVAGVTFSITIATVSQASVQFGPRLMSNFMQDLGNQITLGAFVATFIFCLIVLRTVQGSDGSGNGMFVPNVSIGVGMLLAMASLAVLIYFFQHIPDSIHISMMISGVGLRLRGLLDDIYPTRIGEGPERDPIEEAYAAGEGMIEGAAPVFATAYGYVQHIDADALLAAARQYDLMIWVSAGPGTFVDVNVPIAYVKPAAMVDDRAARKVRAGYIVGRMRTQTQDVLFLVNQLVEVAAKALSPGVNDPITAITCVNWLTSGLIQLGGRDIPSACRHDSDGDLRVVAPPISYAQFADAMLGQLRPYVETDRNAAIHMMDSMARIAYHTGTTERARILLTHAEALCEGCREQLGHPQDREAIETRFRLVAERLAPQLS